MLDFIRGHEVLAAVVLIAFLTAMNLRGVRESGKAFAVPVYLFMLGIIGMGVFGFIQHFTGTLTPAESAPLQLIPEGGQEVTGLAAAFLLLRAFSSGCAALTGVEAISNGVPAFKKPKSRNAASTLFLMGSISITMLASIIALSQWAGIKIADNPAEQLLRDGVPVGEDYVQHTAIGQLSESVFADFHLGVIFVSIVTGLILILAANTAFNGFPVLGSILARDGYLPRQLHTRGDRLAFSNGILILAGAAIVLVIVFKADVNALLQLYIVGVFVSFTTSQIGMVRHWTRHLRLERDQKERARMMRSRIINGIGAAMSATVLVGRARHEVPAGRALRDHRDGGPVRPHARHQAALLAGQGRARDRLEPGPADAAQPRPRDRLHLQDPQADDAGPVLRPGEPADLPRGGHRRRRPGGDPGAARRVGPARHPRQPQGARLALPCRSPARSSSTSRSIRSGNPRDIVTVYLPEYVLGRWWEQVLHNQSALRLKARLLFTPGVMVVSVPWQLQSSQGAERDWIDEPPIPGSIRSGGL